MRIPLHETLRAGTALGWTSVAAVVVALSVGVPISDAGLVWALTAVAAVAHLVMARLPWATLLPTPRGRLLIDLWAGGVLISVCGLVLIAGGESRLDLLLLLVVPFLAISNDDNPRALAIWMAVAALRLRHLRRASRRTRSRRPKRCSISCCSRGRRCSASSSRGPCGRRRAGRSSRARCSPRPTTA